MTTLHELRRSPKYVALWEDRAGETINAMGSESLQTVRLAAARWTERARAGDTIRFIRGDE